MCLAYTCIMLTCFRSLYPCCSVQENNTHVEQVLRKALRLLEAMAMQCPEVQQMVFERLDELLSVRVAEDQVALAVKQVFSNNEVRPHQAASL